MQLWQMDIVGGVSLVSAVTGELREAKVVTAVDDYSQRYGPVCWPSSSQRRR